MPRCGTAAVGVALLSLMFDTMAHAAEGAALFAQNCALCHQTGAIGLAGQFPRLAGRVSAIASQPDGRTYLIDVLTYGLSGSIRVDGEEIIGVMPPFAILPNDVVAELLSYLETLGDSPRAAPQPFGEQEVAMRRAKPAMSADEVQAERLALQRRKLIP